MYEDLTIQIGSCEGYPVMATIPADEQQQFVESGYGSVSDLVSLYISTNRDWQCDC